jgi:hypothetical protein
MLSLSLDNLKILLFYSDALLLLVNLTIMVVYYRKEAYIVFQNIKLRKAGLLTSLDGRPEDARTGAGTSVWVNFDSSDGQRRSTAGNKAVSSN